MFLLPIVACRPYQPPPEPPALEVAAAVRVVAAPERRIAVRAGSAFDPPGREGLAWVAARIVAMRIDAEVDVGREIVELRLRGGTDGLTRIWSSVSDAELAAVARPPERDCAGEAEDAYATWAWAGHPYGHPVWGRRSTLPTLRPVEVEQFLRKWWVRGAMMSSEVMPALDGASPRLIRAPVPAFPPTPPAEEVLRVRGVGACAAVGGSGRVDATGIWPLFTTAPPPVQSEGLYVVAVPLPDGASGEARLVSELRSWADGALPPFEPPVAAWARALIPVRGAGMPEPAPASAVMARWMSGDRLRMVVVLPDAAYDRADTAPSVADLVR